MDSIPSESADDDQGFRYQPLANPGSSIRLIEVDPDLSTDDLLQVHLFDSALSEEYTCLSYVWGQENDGGGPFAILVNSKVFHVRHNLHGFLHVARKKYPKRRFWIDAICIDQGNTPERNHQVQQMGEIYSRAKEVIAWLGNNKTASYHLSFLNSRARHTARHIPAVILSHFWISARLCIPQSYMWGSIEGPLQARSGSQGLFEYYVGWYWGRAWVTQEIILAKHVRVLMHKTEFDLDALKFAKTLKYRLLLSNGLTRLYDAHNRDPKNRDQHLLALLYAYGDKICTVERDRIFSLLSICVEGAGFPVDYSMSEEKLLHTVLRTSRLNPCLCSVRVASRSIDVDRIPKDALRMQHFIKVTVQTVDVFAHKATKRRWRSCCSDFSINSFAERSDGQLFCLSKVCTLLEWHLFLFTEESGKQHVYGIMCKSRKNKETLSLGENGTRVKISASPRAESHSITLGLGLLLELFTTNSDMWRGPDLCDTARQTGVRSTVEYLDLES